MLTREEKEKLVIQLYEQGKSFREIAQELHLSFGTISSVIKRYTRETKYEEEKKGTEVESKDSRVFKLFEDGKTPIQVVIESGLNADEVRKMYKEWFELRGLQELYQLYEEIKEDLFEFHEAYKFASDGGVSMIQLVDAAKCLEHIPFLETRLNNIKIEIQDGERQKQNGRVELGQLQTSIGTAKEELNSRTEATNAKKAEYSILNSRNEQLKTIIAMQKQTKDYRKVKAVAKKGIHEIFSNKKLMLHEALTSVIEAIREDPNKQLLIYDPLDYPTIHSNSRIPPGVDPRYFRQVCTEKLLEIAGEYYDKLLKGGLFNTMSSIGLASL